MITIPNILFNVNNIIKRNKNSYELTQKGGITDTMVKTTKRGELDNTITYDHFCDTVEDLQNIDSQYINLGSTATVLSGENGLEIYIANSNKEWILIS